MRLEKIDIMRWIAIILMIFFHLNYSLVNIFNIELLNFSEAFWNIIWKFTALLFIFTAWISFFLAELKYEKNIIKKYIKVSIILGIIASFISLSTYLFLPEQYIKFWIIHFFALSFLLMLLFSKFKYYNILFGIIFITYWIFFIPIIKNEYFYFLWFIYPWFKSADFFPIFPYFWVMLFWYSLALFLKNIDKLNIFKLNSRKNIFYSILEYSWKKSLIIYIIHQPIILLILYYIV